MTLEAGQTLPQPRPAIAATAETHHGAIDYVELETLGMSPGSVLDFSVNSNAFGPSPKVADALRSVPLDVYPDREALALRRALAQRLDVNIDSIIAGNGTAELILLTALAYVQPRDRVLIVGPAFGEYARAARLLGATALQYTAPAETGFAVDPSAVAALVRRRRPRLLFVCRPNNPTGSLLPLSDLAAWADAAPATLLIVDEAYLAFANGARSALDLQRSNILILRSMTKDYALAGLRLGYAVGDVRVIGALRQTRPAWNVSALAQAAGLAALADQDHVTRTLAHIQAAKVALVAGLRQQGLSPLPSCVHFFLASVGDAAQFRRRLLRSGILVRDCASFGLPAHIRIATRTHADNARLLHAIGEVRS